MIKTIIKENLFLDSVFSMTAGKEIKKIDGIISATLLMGTDLNKTVLAEINALTPEVEAAGPNSLIISLEVERDGLEKQVEKKLEELLAGNTSKEENSGKREYKSTEAAFSAEEGFNLTIISVAGEYAGIEAKKALDYGSNVFVFSDNVPLEDELELKNLAQKNGLLVMGPGCGTAVIGGVSIGMMSKIRRGKIGIVAASGSGLQEVAVLLDRWGEGISQAIGTGGRDLSDTIGGITMLQGIELLKNDEETEVIVLISKPPHPSTARKIYQALAQCQKPCVVYFLGGNKDEIEECGAYNADTLENAAEIAKALKNKEELNLDGFQERVEEMYFSSVKAEIRKLSDEQRYLRGLFCGGTHSEEAVLLLNKMLPQLHSNISFGGAILLEDPKKSVGNSLIDMGDEVFTRGKPHPVIDPSVMIERLDVDGADAETAVILFDLLLGHGCNEDPVGVVIESIRRIREMSEKTGKYKCIVCDLCGTDKDPQDYSDQKSRLEALGVHVFHSNSQAAIFAGMVAGRIIQ